MELVLMLAQTEGDYMSQHIFEVREGVECMVGWDPPLQTFFGQVYKVDKESERIDEDEDGNDGLIFRTGSFHAEIRSVNQLQRVLRPHVGTFPREIHDELYLLEID